MTKPWYTSKTLWFNLLALIVTVAMGFGFGDLELAEWVEPIALGLIAVINLILRAVTNKGVRFVRDR